MGQLSVKQQNKSITSVGGSFTLTIVAPFFNEQDGVALFHNAVKQELDPLALTYNFVLVDDGSADLTLTRLNEIAAQDSRVQVLSLSRNFGHQIALTAGLDHANGDVVITMDGDLQHPPTLVPAMLEEFQRGAEIVYAVPRTAENLNLSKRITAGIYYWLLKRSTNLNFNPGAGDFRLMSRHVVDALVSMRETHRYLRGMVPWLGFSSRTLYYDQPDRYAGESKYTLGKMINLARNGLFSFRTVPLEFVTFLGFGITCLGVVYLIYILLQFIIGGYLVPGWASVVVSLLIIGGIQLISIGIIAQYIGMIFEQVKARPLDVLKRNDHASSELATEQKANDRVE